MTVMIFNIAHGRRAKRVHYCYYKNGIQVAKLLRCCRVDSFLETGVKKRCLAALEWPMKTKIGTAIQKHPEDDFSPTIPRTSLRRRGQGHPYDVPAKDIPGTSLWASQSMSVTRNSRGGRPSRKGLTFIDQKHC